MVTGFILLSLLITSVSFLILIFLSPITSLLSLVDVSTTSVIYVAYVCSLDMTHTIDTTFVHCRLDQCNSMYYCLPQMNLNRLQHIQNALARAVIAAPWSSNPDHILT